MTRDDIIEILDWHPSHVEHGASGLLLRIERVMAVAVAREREACADVADQHASVEGIAQSIAAAIRARGNT